MELILGGRLRVTPIRTLPLPTLVIISIPTLIRNKHLLLSQAHLSALPLQYLPASSSRIKPIILLVCHPGRCRATLLLLPSEVARSCCLLATGVLDSPKITPGSRERLLAIGFSELLELLIRRGPKKERIHRVLPIRLLKNLFFLIIMGGCIQQFYIPIHIFNTITSWLFFNVHCFIIITYIFLNYFKNGHFSIILFNFIVFSSFLAP